MLLDLVGAGLQKRPAWGRVPWLVRWALYNVAFNVIAVPFVVLTWRKSIAIWSQVYFIDHLLLAALIVALRCIPGGRSEARREGE